MNGYLLDTNIVTAHLKHHPGVRQHIREAELAGHPVRLNAVSYYETKRGLLAIGAHRQLVAFERLWRVLGIVMIDHAVLDKAGELYAELRASGQLIEDADLLIAAIALVHDMTLVTHNTAHFAQITGLRVEDWLMS
ncbi:MAG: type II toxin-antitoxin system VapC family toxin [Candidatus Entotheonellia bacterium]